ncbi:MAG: H-NS histone family protein [Burkholderiaceae bacterium]
MSTYQELKTEIEQLKVQAEQARLEEVAAALEEIRTLIITYQILPSDLGFTMPGKRAAGPVAARYRDPVSGATWSGRGRTPRWLDGKDRAAFAI